MSARTALALALLALCWVVHYGYELVEPAMQAEAWNVGGALGRIGLLAMVVIAWRSPAVAAAALWWVFEELQVVACGMVWMFKPWPLLPGQDRCSTMVGVPLGLVGLGVAAAAAWRIWKLTERAS